MATEGVASRRSSMKANFSFSPWKTAEEIHEKAIKFSAPASEELAVLLGALKEILALTTRAYAQGDLEMAARVEPLEQVILLSAQKSFRSRRILLKHYTPGPRA